MKGFKRLFASTYLTSIMLCSPANSQPANNQPTPPPPVEQQASPGSEILVTARRRAENAQRVPISITALSSVQLAQKSVQQLDDLTALVPGFRFSSEGGRNTQSLSLRGLGQVPVGEGVPAVVTYFAEVPLPKAGSNIPTFDLSNIQVLEGPQGTLFGRNTIGGAVLVTPQAPTFTIGGYGKVDYGNYDYRLIEGAINLPLSKSIALRVAGQYRARNPVSHNLEGGPGFGDIDERSVRVSLLVEPTSGISNTFIFDYTHAPQRPAAEALYHYNPGVLTAAFGPYFGSLIDPYEAQLAAYAAEQKAKGPFKIRDNLAKDGVDLPVSSQLKVYGFTNTTKATLGDVTFRNIFGYRHVSSYERVNPQGTGTLDGPLGPLVLLHLTSELNKAYLTDEFQILGESKRFNWIAGGFYSHDNPTGNDGTVSQTFDFIANGAHPSYGTSQVTDTNYAIFGQATYEILDGLKLTAGGRYSWDRISACGATSTTGFLSDNSCRTVAATGLPDGVGVVSNKGNAPTWTLDADYTVSKSVFLYATARHGYHGVNVNTPAFETVYTQGGVNPACTGPGHVCPDLLPYQKVGEEKIDDIEVGVKTQWNLGGIRFLANADAFRTRYGNGIQFFNVLATGIPTDAPDIPTKSSIAVNVADFTIKGIEAKLTIAPSRSLSFSFAGAYTHQHIDKLLAPSIGGLSISADQVTLPTPKLSGTASVHYERPVTALDALFGFDADIYRSSKWDAQYGVTLPGYTLVNGRISLSDIRKSGLTVAVYVKNMLDRHYATAPSVLLSTLPTESVFYGDPRTFGIEATYKF